MLFQVSRSGVGVVELSYPPLQGINVSPCFSPREGGSPLESERQIFLLSEISERMKDPLLESKTRGLNPQIKISEVPSSSVILHNVII